VTVKIPIVDPKDPEDQIDKESFKKALRKYFNFKIRLAYPNSNACFDYGLNPHDPFIL